MFFYIIIFIFSLPDWKKMLCCINHCVVVVIAFVIVYVQKLSCSPLYSNILNVFNMKRGTLAYLDMVQL
jgi:hypothetical protein